MTRESEEAARLREALSQCGVFQEDEPKEISSEIGAPAAPPPAAPVKSQKGDDRGVAIRDALDKMFLTTGESPSPPSRPTPAAPSAASPAAAPAERPSKAPVPAAPKSRGETGSAFAAILDKACFAAIDTLHLDPKGTDLTAWCRVQGKRVELGRVPAVEVEDKLRDAGSTGLSGRLTTFLAGPGLQTIELQSLSGPRGARYIARGFSDLAVKGLDEIGLDPEVHAELESELTRVEGGAFILGAPPRHGVKSTLRALAMECAERGKLVASLVPMGTPKCPDGVIDIDSLHPGVAAASALTEALRHDPDVLIAGRLSDPRQAAVAIGAAVAGTRVFCAVNASTLEEARGALRMLRLDDSVIRQSRPVFASQRLVHALCMLCREPDNSGVEEIRKRGISESGLRAATIYRAVGCDRCVSGYRGKFAVMENLSDPDVSTATPATLTAPPAKGTTRVSLTGSLIRAVARGRTTVSELVRTMVEFDLCNREH